MRRAPVLSSYSSERTVVGLHAALSLFSEKWGAFGERAGEQKVTTLT